MIAALAGAALASGVAPETVPFEQLLRDADAIVIAHPADPPSFQETKAFERRGGRKIPDYGYGVSRFVVDRVLRDGPQHVDALPALAPGETVAVLDPLVGISEGMHEMYAEGMSVWISVPWYTPAAPVADGAPRVLFLAPGQTPKGTPAYVLVATDAWEGLERLPAIEAAISAPPAPPAPPGPPETAPLPQ